MAIPAFKMRTIEMGDRVGPTLENREKSKIETVQHAPGRRNKFTRQQERCEEVILFRWIVIEEQDTNR